MFQFRHVHGLRGTREYLQGADTWSWKIGKKGNFITERAEITGKPSCGSRSFWSSSAWREICKNTDIIHLISYAQNDPWFYRKLWIARWYGGPIVRLWVGTDVLWARSYAPARRFAGAFSALGVREFTVADHLAAELREIDIRAEVIPIIADFVRPQAPPPLPDKPTVLAYLSSDYRRNFYGGRIIDALIRRRPSITFLIVHDADTDYSWASNVVSLGTVSDMASVYARSTLLVRPTAHDGMPRMMLEALSFGRQVVCSQVYPHCHHAADVDGYLRAVDAVLSQPSGNEAGREYVLEHFERDRACRATFDRFTALLRPSRTIRRGAGAFRALASLVNHGPVWRGRKYVPPESDAALVDSPYIPTMPTA